MTEDLQLLADEKERPSGLALATGSGSDALDLWFGLSRASFAIIPRTLMQEMPDEWQGKMAALLNEYDAAYTQWPEELWDGVRAQLTKRGKCVRTPDWLVNYRHPDKRAINSLRPNASGQPHPTEHDKSL